MKHTQLYLSTTAGDASAVARKYGLGIEIAEYCTAWNMDDAFTETHAAVSRKAEGIGRKLLHAPFSELFPCAIDRKARELAAYRYRQAISLATSYHAEKVIIHGGYDPQIYYPIWYIEQSILFWKSFLKESSGIQIVLENVFEEEPNMLLDIIKGVGDPRLRMCLDVGHVNTYSKIPVLEWTKQCAPYISHFHIHNNDSTCDSHSPLMQGSIPMKSLFDRASAWCPNASYTLEVMNAADSVCWLMDNDILQTS